VTRPPQEEFAYPLNENELKNMRKQFGNKAEIISEKTKNFYKISANNIEEKIVLILSRRPSTLSNLSSILEIHQNELLKYLSHLEKEKILKYKIYKQNVYYVLNRDRI
jgi:predicted HTH transcriptional regulator